MTTIGRLFNMFAARSEPFESHPTGSIPFVSNGYRQNGVLGRVEALPTDKVFADTAICVSAFCQATVQRAPFIGRGNGGSGLIVLTPKRKMEEAELWAYAAHISAAHRWKFSFGRMATAGRLANLSLPDLMSVMPNCLPEDLLYDGSRARSKMRLNSLHFAQRRVDSLFKVQSGEYHSLSELAPGNTPVVSCGALDNGIIAFCSAAVTHRDKLTIAYNGDYPMMAKYHPYEFIAKDDVAVLMPLEKMPLATVIFVQMLFNREVWRHSYGRKLYKGRLEKFLLSIPVDDSGAIDHAGIEAEMSNQPLWQSLSADLALGLDLVRRQTLALVQEGH